MCCFCPTWNQIVSSVLQTTIPGAHIYSWSISNKEIDALCSLFSYWAVLWSVFWYFYGADHKLLFLAPKLLLSGRKLWVSFSKNHKRDQSVYVNRDAHILFLLFFVLFLLHILSSFKTTHSHSFLKLPQLSVLSAQHCLLIQKQQGGWCLLRRHKLKGLHTECMPIQTGGGRRMNEACCQKAS